MKNASLVRYAAGVVVAFALAAAAVAAEPVSSDRATPGTVTPSTGVTKAEPPAQPAPTRPASTAAATAGSLNGAPPSDCAALRREYARSQACFAPYRLANGGLRPEAAGRCKDVTNPTQRCGPEVVSPK